MKKMLCKLLVVALASLLLQGGLFAKKYKGIVFPKTIGSFLYQDYHDYEKESPGLGRSFAYRTSNGVTATLYVYNLKQKEIEDGPDSSLIRDSAVATAQEIGMVAEQQGYTDLVVSNFDKISVGTSKLWLSRISYNAADGTPRHSIALLTGFNSQIFKVRMTGAVGEDDFNAVVAFFLKDLGGKVLKPKKSRGKKNIMINKESMNAPNGTLYAVYTIMKRGQDDPYSFETERSAMELVALAWGKEDEDDDSIDRSDQSLQEFYRAFQAGFLSEYIWYFNRNYIWDAPEGLRMKAFEKWMAEEMPDHTMPGLFFAG